jgi:Uma2 family endonuclease
MEVTSTEVQNNFGSYLRLAQFEDVVVTRNGSKVAVIKAYKADLAIAEKAENYPATNEKISFDDFLKLSEASENRYEYIDGEIYLLTSPGYNHQSIVVEVLSTMHSYFKGKKCRPLTAPFDISLTVDGQKNVVQPDILVICDTENINEKSRYTGVPTLVVEVLSETTQKKDMLKKLNLYLHAGIEEYWIVSPLRKEIYFYRFASQDISEYHVYTSNETLQSIVFNDLTLKLEDIFAGV